MFMITLDILIHGTATSMMDLFDDAVADCWDCLSNYKDSSAVVSLSAEVLLSLLCQGPSVSAIREIKKQTWLVLRAFC